MSFSYICIETMLTNHKERKFSLIDSANERKNEVKTMEVNKK